MTLERVKAVVAMKTCVWGDSPFTMAYQGSAAALSHSRAGTVQHHMKHPLPLSPPICLSLVRTAGGGRQAVAVLLHLCCGQLLQGVLQQVSDTV